MEPGEEEKPEDLPNWLNEEYFNGILDRYFREYKINKFSVFLANRKSEHYSAILYRINFEIEIDDVEIIEKSFIVKSFPSDKFQNEFMKDFNVFPKETEMYDQVIPQFEQLFKNIIGEKIEFGPRCFKINKYPYPTNIIVLEDLFSRGYRMENCQEGLTLDKTMVLLKKIAKFHAMSAVYFEQNGSYDDCFNEGMNCEKMRSLFVNFHDINFKVLMDSMRRWPFGKQYAEKLCKIDHTIFDKILEITKVDENGFNVLNHGALWTNNIIFKFDENNKPIDLLLIDFQFSFWGSPVIDLQYFIVTSCSNDIKIKEHNKIIAYYHKYLIEYLKKLGYTKKIPTLIELHTEILRKSFFSVMTSLGILSIIKLPSRKDTCMDILMLDTEEAEKFRYSLYNNPLYIEAMKDLLPYFDNIGALNIEDL